MTTFSLPPIGSLNQADLRERLQIKLDQKTKPLGALGRLESLALQLGMILGSETPSIESPQMIVCAADHGLAARGVSAYPSDVTWQMVENFLAGGAAVSVLARQHALALTVVDCGVSHDFTSRDGLLIRKVAAGTRDCLTDTAMTHEQCLAAVSNGMDIVRHLPGNLVLLGEMGIGNTSVASMLLARLANVPIEDCTGAGTGLDAVAIDRKTNILRAVLNKHADAVEPLDALAAFGGYEVATLVGVVLEAASQNRIILVDGFITGAAVLVASRMAPAVLERCVFAHRSGEKAHRAMLTLLGATPLVDLELRLGEGSGAALVYPLLVSACLILKEMASFASAGVSQREPDLP